MKPDIISRKRLKKIEDAVRVEQNKLGLGRKNGMSEGEEKGGGFMEKWDDELEHLTVKLRNLREKAPAGEIGGLRSALAERDALIKELEQALASRDSEIQMLRRDGARLESVIRELKSAQTAESERARALLRSQEKEYSELIGRLEKGQKHLKRDLKKGEGEKVSLKSNISRLEGVISSLEVRLDEKEGRIRELSSILGSREKEISGLGKKKVELKSESDSIIGKIGAEAERLRRELGERETEVKSLRKRLEESERDHKDLVKTNREEVKSLERRIAGLEDAIEVRDENLEVEIKKADSLGASLDEKLLEIEGLRNGKMQLEEDVKQLEKRFKTEVKGLKRELEKKDAEALDLREKLEHWHSVVREELDSAIYFITRQAEEIAGLKAELASQGAGAKERVGLLDRNRERL